MFDVLSMPCDWPVEVTYHEAKAYCKWKGPGYRLPSEAEHNAIRDEGVNDITTHFHTTHLTYTIR